MPVTRNDLSADVRAKVAERCNARLADAVDLGTQVKQAHWNVRGPNFAGLHALFDAIAADAGEYADLVAERAVQLGGIAMGTAKLAAQRSSLPEYPANATGWRDCAAGVASALAAFGKSARADIDWAAGLGDAGTADILTEISRGTDKWLWQVEAHLEER